MILPAPRRRRSRARTGDVVVFAQKIVSKTRRSARRSGDRRAVGAGAASSPPKSRKDPRLVELVLSESRRIGRRSAGRADRRAPARASSWRMPASINRTSRQRTGGEHALLLPADPDASAARLRAGSGATGRLRGRRSSSTTVSVARGASAPSASRSAARACRRSSTCAARRTCLAARSRSRVVAYADEIAAAASLLMGQADEARPVVILRGLTAIANPRPASTLLRPPGEDLFR